MYARGWDTNAAPGAWRGESRERGGREQMGWEEEGKKEEKNRVVGCLLVTRSSVWSQTAGRRLHLEAPPPRALLPTSVRTTRSPRHPNFQNLHIFKFPVLAGRQTRLLGLPDDGPGADDPLLSVWKLTTPKELPGRGFVHLATEKRFRSGCDGQNDLNS